MKPTVLIFSTSPNAASRSRAAAEALADCLNRRGMRTEFADVCDLPAVWVTGEGLSAAGERWIQAGEKVENACAVIFAAPIYCYTVGSPARVVVELLSDKLAGKPIGLITAAGSVRSALAHRDFLNSLSDEVSAPILPKAVQVTGTDFSESGELSPEIQQRISELADAVIDATHSRLALLAQKVNA